jgi:prepilin-type processing-associated H-X9-DG protein
MAVAALLAALWFGFNHLGERGRTARCARNLGALGQAIGGYASDHNDGIPAAAIDLESAKRTWDMELLPYLKPSLARSQGAYEQRQRLLAAQPCFFCPSDPVQRGGHPRSYSMSARDMASGWPPEAGDKTGVGVLWSKDTVGLLGDAAAPNGKKDPESLPKLKRYVMPNPAGTLLLTELMTPGNTMGSVLGARIFGVNEQEGVFKQAPRLHSGRFNYLMADGQVAWLTGLQTGGLGGKDSPAGIWTVKAGD